MKRSLGQWAPWISDPDPPEEPMDPAQPSTKTTEQMREEVINELLRDRCAITQRLHARKRRRKWTPSCRRRQESRRRLAIASARYRPRRQGMQALPGCSTRSHRCRTLPTATNRTLSLINGFSG
jgi:hypothetical protein